MESQRISVEVDARDRGVLYTYKRMLQSYCGKRNIQGTFEVTRDRVVVNGQIPLPILEKLAESAFTSNRQVKSYNIKR